MRQPEIVALLKSLGFSDLHLKAHENKSSTYKFSNYDRSRLEQLGESSVTSDGKVAIYVIPKVGKLGVSPKTSLVRFIDQTSGSDDRASDKHLGDVKVTPALSKAFLQASANPGVRVAYCKKLFAYLNEKKFGGRLPQPVLVVSERGPIRGARGVYTRGPSFGPGTLWVASFLFNAREQFFLEVFLHELCHQAAWVLSKSTDTSDGGHGPVWQDWMRLVGLEPRRFDPTDTIEYKTSQEVIHKEADLVAKYGPRSKVARIDALEPLPSFREGEEVIYVWEGRIFRGEVKGLGFYGVRADVIPRKGIFLKFKKKSQIKVFRKAP